MTTETKTFIQLEDITALCFACKHCQGTSLNLCTGQVKKGVLDKCPSCGKGWTEVRNGMIVSNDELAFLEFVAAVEKLKELTGNNSHLGFSLALQIKQPQPK